MRQWLVLFTLWFSSAAFGEERGFSIDVLPLRSTSETSTFVLSNDAGTRVLTQEVSSHQKDLLVSLAPDRKYQWTWTNKRTGAVTSGMMLTVARRTEGDRYLEIKWPVDLQGAKFYLRLWHLSDKGTSLVLSSDERVFIERGADNGMIYITAVRDKKPVVFDSALFNSLQIIANEPIEKIPEPAPAPREAEPAPAKKKTAEPIRDDIIINTFKNPPPALSRRPYVQINGKYARETFNVTRDDSFDSPAATIIGGGFEGFYQSQSGLFGRVTFDSHGTDTTYDASDSTPPGKLQKRYEAGVSVGIDIFNLDTRDEENFLGFALLFQQRQLPLDRDDQTVRSIGADVSYVHYMKEWDFKLEGSLDQFACRRLGLSGYYKITEAYGMEFGYYDKKTFAKGKDHSEKRGEDSSSNFQERGFTGGIRLVL